MQRRGFLGLGVAGLSAQASEPGPLTVRLRWRGQAGETYNVFRADNAVERGLTNPLRLLTPEPIEARVFVDPVGRAGLYIYQVRAYRRVPDPPYEMESAPAEIWVVAGPQSPLGLEAEVVR